MGRDYLKIDAGGSLLPATAETVTNKQHYVFQDGKTVFKWAVSNMADVSEQIMNRNNLTNESVDWLVPHQANIRIIEAMAKKLNLPIERVAITLNEQGNTSSASIPLALDKAIRDRLIKQGDLLMLEGFGGGLAWGSALIRY